MFDVSVCVCVYVSVCVCGGTFFFNLRGCKVCKRETARAVVTPTYLMTRKRKPGISTLAQIVSFGRGGLVMLWKTIVEAH